MKLLIADDHSIFRRGLREILFEAFEKAVIGEAENARQILEALPQKRWDALVLDISMPGRSGLDILPDIRKICPKLPVLFLSMHPEDKLALQALRAGASGYVTKIHAPTELVAAIKKIVGGGIYVSPAVAEKLAANLSGNVQAEPHEKLSPREFQIMQMMASGQGLKEIASQLSLSVQTVSTHRARLLKKMGLQSNAQVMRYALDHRLVE
ncbi:MAG: response regulator transcription factor [Verrucomicrobiota bacterium]